MKVIGLIGGMSWESSLVYYRLINEGVKRRLGGLHSAKSLMYSVDFDEVERLQHGGRWAEAAGVMADAAVRLERGGADFIVICTNTMHKMAGEVEAAVGIPLLHIADATADKAKADGHATVGLLGTRYTMEEEFYRGRLERRHGLRVQVPGEADRGFVHDVIYGELCLGDVRPKSREEFKRIITELGDRGAEAVILGCTEIGMLVKDGDCPLPLYDTTRVHAERAVEYALAEAKP